MLSNPEKSKEYEWTKVSAHAITEQGYLVKHVGEWSDGESRCDCLFEGWWEASIICPIQDRCFRNAEPISIRAAKAIISKEEKLLEQRPKERESWVD